MVRSLLFSVFGDGVVGGVDLWELLLHLEKRKLLQLRYLGVSALRARLSLMPLRSSVLQDGLVISELCTFNTVKEAFVVTATAGRSLGFTSLCCLLQLPFPHADSTTKRQQEQLFKVYKSIECVASNIKHGQNSNKILFRVFCYLATAPSTQI